MNRRFQSEEIRCISEQYANNELYKAVGSIGPQLESELPGFGLCPEECFGETLELLSAIADKGEDFLQEVENVWLRKSNEYKRFDRNVSEDVIRKAVGIVFGFAILAIDSSQHPFYRRTLSRRLMQVIASHKFDGWAATLERIFSVPLPEGWFDAYCTFTMPAAKPSSSKKKKSSMQAKAGKKILSGKPMTLKYYTHGNKGIQKKQGNRLRLVFDKWNEWGWINSETATDDFDAFFEGEPRHCNITWMASTTVLTFLLQELLKQPYIAKQTRQSPSSMVKEQFGLTPNFDRSRLADDDKFRIEVTVFLLDINNPLPLIKGGDDEDYDTKDAAFQAVLSGHLRKTKGI